MEIRESFSPPNGTPLKLRGFQPDQSRCVFRSRLCEFQVVSGFLFYVYAFMLFFILFWEEPWTTKDQFWGSWGLQGQFWRYSVFKWLSKKSKNHEKLTCECFPWQFSTKFEGIDAESQPGHFPTIGFTNREVQGQKKTKFINWGGLLTGGGG